jgi:hypothetical protein
VDPVFDVKPLLTLILKLENRFQNKIEKKNGPMCIMPCLVHKICKSYQKSITLKLCKNEAWIQEGEWGT